MAMPRPDDRRYLNTRALHADRLLVLAFVAAVAWTCWTLVPAWSIARGGPVLSGPAAFAMVAVGPWWIFHVMFSGVTFLHHTHPAVPWFRTKKESNFFAGQVRATVHVELPLWAERLLHNITVHSAHHVDPRVPFRSLPEAQRRLEAAFTDDIHVERWSLLWFIRTTRTCRLYDYDAHCWVDFSGRPMAPVTRSRS